MVGSRGSVMMNRPPVFAGIQRGGVRFRTGFNRPFSPVFFRHHHRFFPWRWYGYGGFYEYPYYPSYYGDYQSQDSYDYASAAYVQNSQMLQAEVERLNDEVERLRQDRETRAAPPTTPSQGTAVKAKSQPTQLVFRDKRTEEVQNYAIVGQTFWIFSEQRARKIPLAELDIPATEKANQASGVDFQLPK
jgi:hypothetical protein